MKIIERYIFAVTEYLPEELREDVAEELRTNIEERLPDNPTDEDIYAVLQELGNPWQLAAEYNQQRNYLIGPAYYRSYIGILKLVVSICIMVGLLFTILDWVMASPASVNLFDFIIQLFGSAIDIALQGAFWVTIVFVILERSGAAAGNLPFSSKNNWSPKDLPGVQTVNTAQVSRVETVFEIFFLMFFTSFFYLRPQFIALYTDINSNSPELTPLFDLAHLERYLPFIVMLALFNLIILIWKLVWGGWHFSLAISNLIYNALTCLLAVVMLLDAQLFNTAFFAKINQIFDIVAPTAQQWPLATMWILIGIIILISIWDAVEPFTKLNRHSKCLK